MLIIPDDKNDQEDDEDDDKDENNKYDNNNAPIIIKQQTKDGTFEDVMDIDADDPDLSALYLLIGCLFLPTVVHCCQWSLILTDSILCDVFLPDYAGPSRWKHLSASHFGHICPFPAIGVRPIFWPIWPSSPIQAREFWDSSNEEVLSLQAKNR